MRADVGIIGGGASGMAAAIAAARHGEQVLLLERYDQVGKKLLATGNGRCNLMNRHEAFYGGDGDFARQVMGTDPVRELEDFWESLGLFLRYDGEGRGYPCTFMASTVTEVLKAEMKRLKAEIRTGVKVTGFQKQADCFRIEAETGEAFRVKRLILATGGAAQPKLGGNRSARPWLETLGHPMAEARPALVPLKTEARSVSGLSGIRVKCAVTLERDGRTLHGESGELLFTDEGVSGICVMQCSRFLPPDGQATLTVNLAPDLFPDREALFTELRRRRDRDPEGEPTELLRGLTVPRVAYAVCRQAGLRLRGEKNSSLDDGAVGRIADTLRGYRLKVTGTEGFERAQVMAGGARCEAFDPRTMESGRCPGLHAAGELLNVDGDCGGYNLMFAFLSGLRAGENGRQYL